MGCESSGLCSAADEQNANVGITPCLSHRDQTYNANKQDLPTARRWATFIATSNEDVAKQAIKISRESTELLSQVIKKSKVWVSSFSSQEEQENSDDEAVPDPAAQTIQGSWSTGDMVKPCKHGLVSAILDAYNNHHNLVLRPDDFWSAIMIQFGFYVTGNSEALRDRLVNFEGKTQLEIIAGGTLFTADFGNIANRMVDEQITKNIKDSSIVDWVIPKFSTTTSNDRIVCSVSLMAALQNFFEYKFSLKCGIPSVTLLGTTEDWAQLREKIDRLVEFEISGSDIMNKWQNWLSYICDNLEASANGQASLEFWDKVACHLGGGSGPSYISGWLSAFAVFNAKGEWQGDKTRFAERHEEEIDYGFPVIDTSDLPSGITSVPVLVDDNGKEYDCFMFAGHMGYTSGQTKDTIIPRSDWCIATKL